MSNGSACVYAGGTANNQSNYHQLVVKRPPGTRLSLTACPFAITVRPIAENAALSLRLRQLIYGMKLINARKLLKTASTRETHMAELGSRTILVST